MKEKRQEKKQAMASAMLTAAQIEKNATIYWDACKKNHGAIIGALKKIPSTCWLLHFSKDGTRYAQQLKSAQPHGLTAEDIDTNARAGNYFLLSRPENKEHNVKNALAPTMPLIVCSTLADFNKLAGTSFK